MKFSIVLRRAFFCASALLAIPLAQNADAAPICAPATIAQPEPAVEKLRPVISFIETGGAAGYGSVTHDFDGQGMSAGLLQWNIGKGSLQPLVRRILNADQKSARLILGDYADEVFEKFAPISTSDQLEWIRTYQTTGDTKRWKPESADFVARFSQLMASEAGVLEQELLIAKKVSIAWNCAVEWFGDGHVPTIREHGIFVDVLTFHSAFWKTSASRAKVRAFVAAAGDHDLALEKILIYLNSTPVADQHQVPHARANAKLWRELRAAGKMSDAEVELLVFAYLIADAIGLPNALPFKFVTIGRKGMIALNEGYVNDRDTPKSFPTLD
jgi:hypothetical protein